MTPALAWTLTTFTGIIMVLLGVIGRMVLARLDGLTGEVRALTLQSTETKTRLDSHLDWPHRQAQRRGH